MGFLLLKISKCLDLFGIPMKYPHSYIGGGHAVAWTDNIFIGPISQFWTFMFDNHVVHDNTCVHDINNAVLIPQPCWTLHCHPSNLKHAKCPLHILACRIVSLLKVNLLLLYWESDRLHKHGPPRVYIIRQIVAHIVLVSLTTKLRVGPTPLHCSLKRGDDWRTLTSLFDPATPNYAC